MNQIRLLLPKGSLNDKRDNRANTFEFLKIAGYDPLGYEPGEESERLAIVNDPEIIAFLGRPQTTSLELSRGLVDVAIAGEDWIMEGTCTGKCTNVRKIGNLMYGKVRLVFAVSNATSFNSLTDFFLAQRGRQSPVLCFSEYVNLTAEEIARNRGYRELFGDKKPYVEAGGLNNGENSLVQVLKSEGATETYIRKGADIISDAISSGGSLRNYGLKELDEIIESSAGLYAGPGCAGWKAEKAQEIFELLKSAVIGKLYFDVKFNVDNERVEEACARLISEGLCADEPTVSKAGRSKTALNILSPKGKFPEAYRLLKQLGATAIVRSKVEQYIP